MARGKDKAGKALFGLGKAIIGRVRGKKPTRQIVGEISQRVTKAVRQAPAPSRRQAAAVRRRPTTPEMAEQFYVRPEGYTPRAQTQAVSRTGRDTVARAGEATARQADEAAGSIRGARQVGRRVLFGPRAGTLMTGVPLTAGGKAWGLAGRAVKGGILGGLGIAGWKGLQGGGDGYGSIPEDLVVGVPDKDVVPPGPDATPDEYAAYEEILNQKALAEMGQIDPFATDAMGANNEDIYKNLRSGFGSWAGNLRGYGTAKGAGLRGTYGELSEQALKDAAEAEAIAQAASGDIGRIGRDYSAAATQDIQSPGAGGPTELTGLTPVTGESYDIPGRIADTSQIAADYVLRDLNLTRDDLKFMSGMAQQMGPAYEAQLNENLAMLIADKQFELEQSIFGQQAEDRRSAEANRQQAISDYYNGQLALELMRAEQAPKTPRPVTREQIQAGITNLNANQMQVYMQNFNKLMESDGGRKTLRANGINPDDPNAFNAYLAQEVRSELAAPKE